LTVEVGADGLSLRGYHGEVPRPAQEWTAALGGEIETNDGEVRVLVPTR
jgi:hypothetical protein